LSDKGKKKPTAVVVISTCNETDTIGRVITHLFSEIFPKINGWNCKLLIIIGKSSDNTAALVREQQLLYSNLDLLIKEKEEGIGTVYLRGFQRAVEKHGADVIIEFDGDFQLSTETIAVMLDEVERGADCVLASRRIKNGQYPKERGLKRLINRFAGGFLIRVLLFFPLRIFFKVTDPTTGFKASRVKGFIDRFDFYHLYSRNTGYKLEFLCKIINLNAKVVEIPLKFKSINTDTSKLTAQKFIDLFRTAVLLRFHDPVTLRFLKFATVGFIGFIINAVALEMFRKALFSQKIALYFDNLMTMHEIAILRNPSAWAAAFAAEIAIISNFIMNNFWTFRTARIVNPFKFLFKLFQFNMTSFVAILIQYAIVGFATLIFGDNSMVRIVSLVIAVAFFIVPYNWIVYNKIIWRIKARKTALRESKLD
jgi:dolichol-phosphate mannosyltransferase